MVDEIKQRIEHYIGLLKGILNAVQSVTVQGEGIGTQVTKDLLTHVGGEFAAELLGPQFTGLGKKVTRKYLDQQQNRQKQMVTSSYEGMFEQRLSQIKAFLSTVSIKKRNLISEGNSYLLLKKFASLNNYAKLETKIKRAVTILESIYHEPLIYNKDISGSKIESEHAYDVLHNLEIHLRKLIENALAKISKNWWKERIPDGVRTKAEERKQKNEKSWPWYTGKDLHPIAYVDFTDYVQIIRRRDNWREVFQDIFKEEEVIAAKLKELEHIRNAIAHSRDLTHDEFERLKLNSNDIMKSIRVYG